MRALTFANDSVATSAPQHEAVVTEAAHGETTSTQERPSYYSPTETAATPMTQYGYNQYRTAKTATPKWHVPMLLPEEGLDAQAEAEIAEAGDVVTDSLAQSGPLQGIVLEVPQHEALETGTRPKPNDNGLSWVILVIFFMVVIVCAKFRNNYKYFSAVLSDLTDVRERQNLFDDTVKETSFMLALNVLCILSSGLFLYEFVCHYVAPSLPTISPIGIGIGMGVAGVYSLLMPLLYHMGGFIFSDPLHTHLWVKGFSASQALAGIFLLPIGLLSMFYPDQAHTLLMVGLCGFGLIKILFIFKGLRIFITQFSSWVVFSYYLCSLELVPLVLMVAGVTELSRQLL